MLIILRIILPIVSVVLVVLGIITKNFEFMPYLMLTLGISLLITGVIELQKDKKAFWGYMSIAFSGFAFYVSIQGFLLSYRGR